MLIKGDLFLICQTKSGGDSNVEKFWTELKPILEKKGLPSCLERDNARDIEKTLPVIGANR